MWHVGLPKHSPLRRCRGHSALGRSRGHATLAGQGMSDEALRQCLKWAHLENLECNGVKVESLDLPDVARGNGNCPELGMGALSDGA